MRLLVISPSLPRPLWGAGTRNYYLLKALARKHQVSLLALVAPSELEDNALSALRDCVQNLEVVERPQGQSRRLHQFLDALQGRSFVLNEQIVDALQEALDRLMKCEQYDGVLYESVLIAGYRLPPTVKVIIDQHNIEYELLKRSYHHERSLPRKWYNWRESRLLEPIELERCRQADLVLVTSQREQAFLRGRLPSKQIEVVPNGVDLQVFEQAQEGQEIAGRVVFTGRMDYYPNVDGVLFFARQCWPFIHERCPEATWEIVGANPPPEVQQLRALPGVTVTGFVPEVLPYLAAASVAVAPLQVGGGTRLKILEALAMRKAVVSTTIGCEGLDVQAGKHLVLADRATDFARTVVELLHDPLRRQSLGIAGRALVEAEYSWDRCGTQLLQAVDQLVW